MAQVAADAIRAARDRATKAATLVERMEPYVNRQYDEDSVSAWVNGRTVPPADALLAAAKATDLSLDEWLEDPDDAASFPSLRDRHSDVSHVFATRAEFAARSPPHKLLDKANRVDACGLSLNLLCQQYSTTSLRRLLDRGCVLRCLFLAPHAPVMLAREKEEGYRQGDLSALTQLNIDILVALRRSLAPDVQPRLELATYDQTMRFNLLLIDQRIGVVQPYLPFVRGLDSPTLVLRHRESADGLFPKFSEVFHALWESRTVL
jgi:hypothetical protein